MHILVRHVRVRAGKLLDQRDVELECRRLHLGSGKNQDIQLFGAGVAAEHAVLQPGASGLRIRCRGRNHVQIGDLHTRRARLDRDQWAQVGSHRLRAVEPPPGFEAAIEIHVDADAAPAIKQRLADEFALRLPRTRRWAWGLALLVGVLSLGLPLYAYYHHDAAKVITARVGHPDQLWSSGPLFPAHTLKQTGKRCKACHVTPFQRVRNKACLECHNDVTRHFPVKQPVITSFDGRCTRCHQEHNRPSTLVVRRDSLCIACHIKPLKRVQAGTPAHPLPPTQAPARVEPVTAFTDTDHPQFLVSLLRWSPDGWKVARERLDDPGIRTSSNLKFSHVEHLDFDKVSFADGLGRKDRALTCSDCHKLDRQGRQFEPITMEKSCRACHSLAFDDTAPGRQLPHGQSTAQLRTYLDEYYTRQAALARIAPSHPSPRRVPDRQTARYCTGDPLQCGKLRADHEIHKLFTHAGCVDCHKVDRKNGEWQVRPVRLVSDWFSTARFNHKPHLNSSLKTKNGQCAGCHAARKSKRATDVLIPGLKTCTGCHADNHTAQVPLKCLDCHEFHRPDLMRMASGREEKH